MNKYFALFLFAGLCLANSKPASACSPPSPDSSIYSASVSSAVPAKVVPRGAIQLKVPAQDYAQMGAAIFNVGKVTLRVKQVLNGKFSEPTVRLNTTNVDDCNSWFEPQVGDFFITVLPMAYSDGEPVLDRSGKQEFASMFYKSEELHGFVNTEIPKFAEYSPMTDYSFYDPQKFACLFKENDNFNWSAKAWRRCVGAGEYVTLKCERKQEAGLVCEQNDHDSIRPPELQRGYSFWNYYGMTISAILLVFAILLGMGYFLFRRKLRRS